MRQSYIFSHGMRLSIIDPLQAFTKLNQHKIRYLIFLLLILIFQEVDCVKSQSHLLHASSSSLNGLNQKLSGGALSIQSRLLKEDKIKLKASMETNVNTHVAKSTGYMVGAMALHFFGYEFTRSANLALFTSSTMGFSGLSALPFAMAFVSPFSFILLSWYGKQLEEKGPKVALRMTSLLCVCTIGISAFLIWMMDALALYKTYPIISKTMVWLSYVFQNSYAHLLYTQHWSFIGSVLNQSQGAKWFASIAGISSIASTIGGSSASQLTNMLGLAGLMFMTSLSLLVSTLLGESAYVLSEKHGFQPVKEKSTTPSKNTNSTMKKSTLEKAIDLFKRVPILGVLFCEVLSFQSLSMLLNICFVRMLKSSIVDDKARATWSAKFFASINGVSGILQFFILPQIMKHIDPRWVWRLMPLISLGLTSFQSIKGNPTLFLISGAFFLTKMMDYSFRGVANEMVYVPLDFESRYLGKEIIGVFANRFGKSGISLFLTLLTSIIGDLDVSQLLILATVASTSWLTFALKVSNMILDPKKDKNNNKKN